eukprot:Rhum_TRINITY_DN12957_c0_g1::Rhum_TRINITY_DN12957_c0_g1_i1::g.55643::m.55643
MSESKRRRVESTGSKEQVPAARWSMDSKVAGDAILFGDKKTERFLAQRLFGVSSEQADRITTAFPTLNCLRTMGPEDENNDKTPTTEEVWVNFCTEHKLPDTFKDAAAEHVVVEHAVDSFFKWKKVSHPGGLLTWATLQ